MRERDSMTREYDRDIQAAREEGREMDPECAWRRVMGFLDARGVRLVRGWGLAEDSLPFEGHSVRMLQEAFLAEFGGSDAERGEG